MAEEGDSEDREERKKTNLARTRATLLDQIERPQFSETLQQLHDLFVVQITRQSSNKDLVDRVGDVGTDDSRDVGGDLVRVGTDKVFRTTDLEGAVGEDDAVEAEGGGAFGGVAELRERETASVKAERKGRQRDGEQKVVKTHLDESVVLLIVEVNRNDRLIALQPQSHQILTQLPIAQHAHIPHLVVEEAADALFRRFHADVADVETTGLAGLRAERSAGTDGTKDGRAEEEGRVGG